MTARQETGPARPDDADSYGDVATYYRDFYADLPCGKETGSVARLAHTRMEKPFGSDVDFSRVVEVGAGGGLHFGFVRHGYDTYEMTDLDAGGLAAAKARVGEPSGVSYQVMDAQQLAHGDGAVDRLIATCVLLHLQRPEAALEEWRRVTRPGGVVTAYVPNEPGLLTRLGRGLTTRRAAERSGYRGFDLMMAREHINHGWGLDQMIRHVFRHDELRIDTWPVPRAPVTARVFTVYHATIGGGGAGGAASHGVASAQVLGRLSNT